MRAVLSVIVSSLVCALAAAQEFQAPGPPPKPAGVSDEAPVLSPDAALKRFVLPPGYRLELVASEPTIQDPIVIDWDLAGRLWAVEMPGYMRDIAATGELEPIGRIVVLEDADRDGRMDKRTVFADGLVLARALKVLDAGVLVGEPPNVWLMKDTNGDLRADVKTLVTDQYGRREANVEHNANGLFWAMDNWIHTSETDIALRLRGGRFEVRKTLSRGQWGLTQDDVGRIYRNTNASALHVDLLPTMYFSRNPALRRTRGSYEFLGQGGSDLNATWPARPTPGVNRGYQVGVLREDGTLTSFTAVGAPTIFRGDRLPRALYGNAFVTESSANLVSRIVLEEDAKGLRGRKAYERSEFIASTDERFRPVYLSSAPDGTLYVVDLYRGIIQHKGYITEYLRDQILARKLEQPTGLGRIYRVVHTSTNRDTSARLSEATAAQLVAALSHPNGWYRDTAQRLLVERQETSAIAALRRLFAGTATPTRTKLHALWTLDGLESADEVSVRRALRDRSPHVRSAGLRIAERWLRHAGHPMRTAAQLLLSDPDRLVRAQAAASLGELPQGSKEAVLTAFLEARASDPIAADATLSSLAGSELEVLDLLLKRAENTSARAAAITLVAATIVGGGQEGAVQSVFDKVADRRRPAWQRAALLRGGEVSLLGAAAPGSPAGRGRGTLNASDDEMPCPTCPGGRAGPGGAPAFPSNTGGGRGRGRGRGRGGAAPGLKLTREPALSAVAASDAGDFGKRAAALLERIVWPGKAGVAVAAPLTPDEQARFDAGREVYRNLCVACHQADGRGREKIATTLVGSTFALGPPAVPVRVLINGKEGSVGLMPPLGTVLTDDQIAAVLTYVRREWGNAAPAIDPRTVAQVRPLVAGRTRPWTDQELARLADER